MTKKELADLEQLDDEDLRKRHSYLTEKAAILSVQIEELNDKITTVYDEKRELEDELDRRYMATLDSDGWSVLLEETGTSSNSRYHAANEELKRLMPPDITCAMFSGYRSLIQQRSLTIFVNEESGVVEAAERVINTLLPHMKKLPPMDGISSHHHIEVMDNTCSEHGSLWLLIDQENDLYQLWISRYSNKHLTTRKSLRDLLQYVAERHPYHGCKSC